MKYIRTKDGVYETVTQNLYKNDDILYIDGYGLERLLSQADTIEELCDEFVCIRKDNSKALLSCVDEVLPLRMCYIGIYGAIWVTDSNGAPTLKPVAKMNKEGVLCLI